MKTRCPFDKLILMKLSKGEQFALEEVDVSFSALLRETTPEEIDELNKEIHILTNEVRELKSKEDEMGKIGANKKDICHICCDAEESEKGGIACSGESDHFQCFKCFTLWTEVLNHHKTENFEALKKRKGLIKCPIEECEYVFNRAEICASIKDIDVLEGFMANLMYLENMKAFEEYQDKLQELQIDLKHAEEMGEAGENEIPAKKLGDSSSAAPTTAAERLQKRIELESLAQSLQMNLPDARMCPKCSYGPQVKAACDDLLSHHNQVVSDHHERNYSDEEEDANGDEDVDVNEGNEDGVTIPRSPISRISNACPQCGFLARTWDEWLPWTGSLPSTVSGDAFKLGASDDSTKSQNLSPEEMKRIRINAMERSIRVAAEKKEKEQEARAKRKAEEELKKANLSPADIKKQEQNETYRKLQAEKLRKKQEKELMLKRFKADRGEF